MSIVATVEGPMSLPRGKGRGVGRSCLLGALALVVGAFLAGCAGHLVCPRIAPPSPPATQRVIPNPDGGLAPAETRKVIDNMKGMSEYIDELLVCPCYAE